MEAKWIDAIRSTPLPEPGALTEKALAQTRARAAHGRLPFAVGGLALALTLPVVAALLRHDEARPVVVEKAPTDPLASFGVGRLLDSAAPRTRPVRRASAASSLSHNPPPHVVAPHRTLLTPRVAPANQGAHLPSEAPQRGLKQLHAGFSRTGGETPVRLTTLPGGVNPSAQEGWRHTVDFQQTRDGRLEGTVCLQTPRDRASLSVADTPCNVEAAVFDGTGTLLSTAVATVAFRGGTTTLDFGKSPEHARAQHYLLTFRDPQLHPRARLPDEYHLVALEGDPARPVTVERGGQARTLATLGKPVFVQRSEDQDIKARVAVWSVEPTEIREQVVTGVLLDSNGALVGTARSTLESQEVQLDFGVVLQNATRYQFAFSPTKEGESLRFLARNQTEVLRPLLDSPQQPYTQAHLTRRADGTVQGKLTLSPAPGERGAVPQAYRADVAIYDAQGQLLTTAQAELPGRGGSASVACGPCVAPAYYQVRLTPQVHRIEQNEEKIVAGYLMLSLAGTTHTVPGVRPGPLAFTRSNADNAIQARLTAGVSTAQAADYTFHLALFDEKRTLLSTTTSTLTVPRVELGKPLLLSREIRLSVPAREPAPVRYQLAVTKRAKDPDEGQSTALAQDYLRRLRETKDSQARYVLLVGTEFNQVLEAAALRGDEATVIELVQQCWFGGPESAAKGGNGVTWAAYCPTEEPVKRLLARGVAPGVPDANGNTALHYTYRGEIAWMLLKRGAPVDARNKDAETPLLAQARQCDRWLGRVGVIQALLSKKADPNATDNEGRTALMWAAKNGVVAAVEALLQAGADPKRRDKQGNQARDLTQPWAWQNAPGFVTEETMKNLEREANADADRIRALLEKAAR